MKIETPRFVCDAFCPEEQEKRPAPSIATILAAGPACQRQGITGALTRYAEERIRAAGREIAMVDTASDQGRLPARRTYEASGYRLLPVARYFKHLGAENDG